MTGSIINSAADTPYREMEKFNDLVFEVVRRVHDSLDGEAWLTSAPFPHLFMTVEFVDDHEDRSAAGSMTRAKDGLFVITAVPSAWCFDGGRGQFAYRLFREVLDALDRVSRKYKLPVPALRLEMPAEVPPAPPPAPSDDADNDSDSAELLALVDDLVAGEAMLLTRGSPHFGEAVTSVTRYDAVVDELPPDVRWQERGTVGGCTFWLLSLLPDGSLGDR